MLVDPDGAKALQKLRADGCDVEGNSVWVLIASLPFLKKRRSASASEKRPSKPADPSATRQGYCPECRTVKLKKVAGLGGPGIAWYLYRCPRCESQSVSKELLVLPHAPRIPETTALGLARRLESCAEELEPYLIPVFFAQGLGLKEPRGFFALPKKLTDAASFLSRLAEGPRYRDLARTDAMLIVRRLVARDTGRPHDRELVHLFFLVGQAVGVDFTADNEALKKLARRKREADRKLKSILATRLGPNKIGDILL